MAEKWEFVPVLEKEPREEAEEEAEVVVLDEAEEAVEAVGGEKAKAIEAGEGDLRALRYFGSAGSGRSRRVCDVGSWLSWEGRERPRLGVRASAEGAGWLSVEVDRSSVPWEVFDGNSGLWVAGAAEAPSMRVKVGVRSVGQMLAEMALQFSTYPEQVRSSAVTVAWTADGKHALVCVHSMVAWETAEADEARNRARFLARDFASWKAAASEAAASEARTSEDAEEEDEEEEGRLRREFADLRREGESALYYMCGVRASDVEQSSSLDAALDVGDLVESVLSAWCEELDEVRRRELAGEGTEEEWWVEYHDFAVPAERFLGRAAQVLGRSPCLTSGLMAEMYGYWCARRERLETRRTEAAFEARSRELQEKLAALKQQRDAAVRHGKAMRQSIASNFSLASSAAAESGRKRARASLAGAGSSKRARASSSSSSSSSAPAVAAVAAVAGGESKKQRAVKATKKALAESEKRRQAKEAEEAKEEEERLHITSEEEEEEDDASVPPPPPDSDEDAQAELFDVDDLDEF